MPADTPDDARRFRSALGAFATGVTIVTTRDADGHDVGLTANSFNSVSLDPPMVLWSLARSARSLPAFLAATHFAVHVLAADQEDLSLRFSTRGGERFAGLDLERGAEQVPLLRGCSARFQCRTAFRHEGGDHIIFVGAVDSFDQSDRPPLIFHGGRYALAVQKAAAAEAAADGAEPDSGFSQDFLIFLLARAWQTGHPATPELLASLEAAGLVAPQDRDPRRPVALTEAGRHALIELIAAAKAAEAHAQRNFEAADIHMLERALRAIAREGGPGAPPADAPA